MADRDSKGRFVAGHSVAKSGWDGLVSKRFNGDRAAAREWLGQVGAWAYARQTGIVRSYAFQYPGTPEQFLEKFTRRLDFTLQDVGELKF